MPRHRHWPVTMQAGGVVLRPMRRADEVRWTTTRELDWDWLGPWEATKPPGSHERVGGYRMMIPEIAGVPNKAHLCRGRLGGTMVGPIILPSTETLRLLSDN